MSGKSTEVLAWLKSMNLMHDAHQLNISNGYFFAKICSCYFPKDMKMYSFGKEDLLIVKILNWSKLKEFLKKFEIALPDNMIQRVIHSREGAADIMLRHLYENFRSRPLYSTIPHNNNIENTAYDLLHQMHSNNNDDFVQIDDNYAQENNNNCERADRVREDKFVHTDNNMASRSCYQNEKYASYEIMPSCFLCSCCSNEHFIDQNKKREDDDYQERRQDCNIQIATAPSQYQTRSNLTNKRPGHLRDGSGETLMDAESLVDGETLVDGDETMVDIKSGVEAETWAETIPGKLNNIAKGILELRRKKRFDLLEKLKNIKDAEAQAVVFSCMDSRLLFSQLIPSEIIDMYHVRNAGNLIPNSDSLSFDAITTESGALELGCISNNIPNVLVCGHSDCKAMSVLYDIMDTIQDHEGTPLQLWLKRHGARSVAKYKELLRIGGSGPITFDDDKNTSLFWAHIENDLSPVDKLSQINLLQQLLNIASYPFLKKKLLSGEVRLHAIWFDVDSCDYFVFNQERQKFVKVTDENADQLLDEGTYLFS